MIAVRSILAAGLVLGTAWCATCPDDPELDLCDANATTTVLANSKATTTILASQEGKTSGASRGQISSVLVFLFAGLVGSNDGKFPVCASLLLPLVLNSLMAEAATTNTCKSMKDVYKDASCCGAPTKEIGFQIVPDPKKRLALSTNPCHNKKPAPGGGFDNIDCYVDGVLKATEQAGGDVTASYTGGMNVSGRTPITEQYFKKGLCPVNVHWHLGAEHRSAGQYDESGKSPQKAGTPASTNTASDGNRRLAGNARYGYACHKYDANDAKFTTPYKWQHCVDMHVGETYEVHWPHSALGACHTPWQYQTPFYDGVLCHLTGAILADVQADGQNLVNAVGVQSQVFTIVNDEKYYYPDLIRGAIVDGEMWKDVAAYTGSTTGTSRNNTICSTYTPVTWQVDRKCHLISASTFDKMCADMKQQADDMSGDLHAHGSRETVRKALQASNVQNFRR